jgi:amino acid transporter
MNEHVLLQRLRTFLRWLAAALFAGTVAELLLAGHTDSPMQFVPFVLCMLGLLMLWRTRRRPSHRALLALRLSMAVIAAGSLLGAWEHFEGNYEFARETHPHAARWTLIRSGLTGRDPLLAPGILAAAAAVTLAATYGVDAPEGQGRKPTAGARAVPVAVETAGERSGQRPG